MTFKRWLDPSAIGCFDRGRRERPDIRISSSTTTTVVGDFKQAER